MVGRMYRSGWEVEFMLLYHVYSYDMCGGTPNICRQNGYDIAGDVLYRRYYTPPYLFALRYMDYGVAYLTFASFFCADLFLIYRGHSFIALPRSHLLVCATVCIFFCLSEVWWSYWGNFLAYTGISHVNILLWLFKIILFVNASFTLVVMLILSKFHAKLCGVSFWFIVDVWVGIYWSIVTI